MQYHTSLSSYVFEKPDEVRSREATIDSLWAELDALSQARSTSLAAALATEVRKEDLRLEFADLASDFARFVNETLLRVGSAEEQRLMCGSTLQEVVAYGKLIATEDGAAVPALDAKMATYGKVAAEMTSLACNDNPYTDLTVAALQTQRSKLDGALAARLALQQQEEKEQQTNDAMCKQFADVAIKLAQSVDQQIGEVFMLLIVSLCLICVLSAVLELFFRWTANVSIGAGYKGPARGTACVGQPTAGIGRRGVCTSCGGKED